MDSTILIVNISKAFGKVLEHFFKSKGFKVLVAEDAITAFQLFIMHHVDLVLTDYYLPNISGGELVKTFRTNKEHKNLPIVVFTASPETELIEECKGAGASLVLDKSMDHGELIKDIKKLVEEYQETLNNSGLDQDLAVATVKATTEVMATMMNMEVESTPTTFEKITPHSAEVIGSVGVAGVLSGSITIFMNKDMAATITAKMLMMEPEEIEGDEELVDAIGETANMIAGNIKTHLFQKVPLFDISTPSVTIGSEVRRTSVADQFGLLAPFYYEGKELLVEFLLMAKEKGNMGVSLNIMTDQGVGTADNVES